MLQSMGSQRVGHNLVTKEQQQFSFSLSLVYIFFISFKTSFLTQGLYASVLFAIFVYFPDVQRSSCYLSNFESILVRKHI